MRWHQVSEQACKKVRARLGAEGPLTATQLGGAKGGGPWWDWSEVKVAAEWLLDIGELVCVRRDGWRRIYDLPERVLPPELLAADPDDAACVSHLVGVATRALGAATQADLVDYHRLQSVLSAQTEPERLPGRRRAGGRAGAGHLPRTAFGRARLGRPGRAGGRGEAGRERHRVTLLSPFDSLVWDRKRTRRLFGFEHSLEAYVPKAKRVHGYFVMPLLAGGRLVGRVDPAREGRTLVARKLTLDRPSAAEPMARALKEAATWVNCDYVELEQVEPTSARDRLSPPKYAARAAPPAAPRQPTAG